MKISRIEYPRSQETIDDVTPELKRLLDFIDGKAPKDEFTRELDGAVQSASMNPKDSKRQMKYKNKQTVLG